MTASLKHQAVLSALDQAAETSANASELMTRIVEILSSHLPDYNWVGFYMIEDQPGGEPLLVLGPYVGAPTEHVRIPLNRGICGAAASTGKTVVIDDVNSDPRYLACSIETKSEIVVPVFAKGKVVGELDIDSHRHAAFAEADRALCQHAAELLGRVIGDGQ